MTKLLEINDLSIEFDSGAERNRAINNISITVDRGEIVGVVGESGCGKTITGLSVLRLLPDTASITSGNVRIDGDDVLSLSNKKLRALRGSKVAMIFQDPSTSLNPVFTVASQMRRVVKQHRDISSAETRRLMSERLEAVGLSDIDRVLAAYPHELSGGMKQRVMIAMALIGEPELLIADEPTTALDVTVQSQILALLMDIRDRFDLGIMLISHDLGVVSQVVDRVVVLYAGSVVERGPVPHFAEPEHPYTKGLIGSIPKSTTERGSLEPIEGTVPYDPGGIGGCVYASRCPDRMDVCLEAAPSLDAVGIGTAVACYLVGQR
ncbi:MAG: ABC transporter ATP-binding protein [Actinomycetia bacterium]|nr:ABC transporter ATP-binding protein [Actinomycetes bacterium]